MLKKSFLIVLVSVFFMHCAFAQTTPNYTDPGQLIGKDRTTTITTAVPFLLVAPDSRSAGMGDIGVASSSDINSQHHNPAKYVFNKDKIGVSISYSPWLRKLASDINLAYLAAYWKITKNDAIAISLRYFSLGDIQFTDGDGNNLMVEKPNEFSLDFTYSRKLSDYVSMALTPRFIYSDLTAGQYVANAITKAGLAGAADLSLFYERDLAAKGLRNSTIRCGFNISNMGNKISYTPGSPRRDFLPTNLRLGLSYSMDFDQYNKLSILGEAGKLLVPTKPQYASFDVYDSITGITKRETAYDAAGNPVIFKGYDDNVSVFKGMIQSLYDAPGGFKEEMCEWVWALGMEYVYRDLLSVRFGYFNESGNRHTGANAADYDYKNKGGRKYLTIGAGIHYSVFALDVSYLISVYQNHPLENTLRFTLSFNFASTNKEEIKKQGIIQRQ